MKIFKSLGQFFKNLFEDPEKLEARINKEMNQLDDYIENLPVESKSNIPEDPEKKSHPWLLSALSINAIALSLQAHTWSAFRGRAVDQADDIVVGKITEDVA